MSTIKVNIPQILTASETPLDSAEKEVSGCLSLIKDYYSQLNKKIPGMNDISNSFKNICKELAASSEKIKLIKQTIVNDMTLYGNVENIVRNYASEIPKIRQINNPSGNASFFNTNPEKTDVTKNASTATGISGGNEKEESEPTGKPVSPTVVEDYLKKVTDAEYAKLCGFCNSVADDSNPADSFLRKLESLPEGDPLRTIDRDNIHYFKSKSGLTAIIIHDESGNALVVFAGTNPSRGEDLYTDALITVGKESPQSNEANQLISSLSKKCKNIVVAGHSLGGYLATSVALNHNSVSKCIAFDPPGRYDAVRQINNNRDNYGKIKTYESKGSVVSAVGSGIGNVIEIDVLPYASLSSGNSPIEYGKNMILELHSIDNISQALGGETAIDKSWMS